MCAGPAVADDTPQGQGDLRRTKAPAAAPAEENPAGRDLLDGLRSGDLGVGQAEGRGDGRMTLSVTNRPNKKLRVVLPPGLVA